MMLRIHIVLPTITSILLLLDRAGAAPMPAARSSSQPSPTAGTLDVEGVTELGDLIGRLIPVPLSKGDGTAYGDITSSLLWQSSGTLSRSGCPLDVNITDCYSLHLDGTGNLQEPIATEARRRRRSPVDELLPDEYFNGPTDDLVSDFGLDWDGLDLKDGEERHGLVNRAACSAPTTPSTRPPPTTTTATRSPAATTTTTTTSRTTRTTTVASTATIAPASPRQRIEFLTWPPYDANTSVAISWRTFQATDTRTSAHFFHAWQIIRRDACGGPVLSLEYVGGKAVLVDTVRGCDACVSVPVSHLFGKTIQHNLFVTFGPNGFLAYSAIDTATNEALLDYSATGDMGNKTSLKFGNYRAWFTGIGEAQAYAGDFSALVSSG